MERLYSYDLQYILSPIAFKIYSNSSLAIYNSGNVYLIADNSYSKPFIIGYLADLNNFLETLQEVETMLKETFKTMLSEKYQVTKKDLFDLFCLVMIFLTVAHLETL